MRKRPLPRADHADLVSQEAQDGTGVPVRPDATGYAALELALQVGDALLSAGMSAHDVVVLMLCITGAYGLQHVHVDVTYTSMSVSHDPGPANPPLIFMRVIRPEVPDFTKVRELNKLCADIETGLPIDQAVAEFDRIRSIPHPYAWWVAMTGNAAVGPAVTLLFTTSWKLHTERQPSPGASPGSPPAPGPP